MNASPMGDERLTTGQRLMLALLGVYKVVLSQMFAGSCRFVPSCSEYARDAVITHVALKGSWLAARRLARCHPAGSFGVDPVPPRTPRTSR
jgi:putative membrane protein insertion efficiency factor